ncbi:HDOD domain-containing protein [Candidatus Nitrospira bockiana]
MSGGLRTKRLLLVDDDPGALAVMCRMVEEGLAEEWAAVGVHGAQEALAALQATPFDLVLADIHLVGMGGVQLLTEVKERYPGVVRVACSGCAHPDTVLRVMQVAHRYLPKPFSLEVLKELVSGTAARRPPLQDPAVLTLVAGLRTLPSLPGLYQELIGAMESPHASLETAARIISRDIAMLSKLLQVVNSAFFGLRRTIASPGHAVALLGLDRVKALVLGLKLFEQCEVTSPLPLSLDQLWHHGLATAVAARAIARLERAPILAVEGAFMGGLLHDVGRLLLVTNFPDRYGDVLRVEAEGGSRLEAERAVFGATHADLGGYLLSLWGLSPLVSDAAAFHHDPRQTGSECFTVTTAVHVAGAADQDSAGTAQALASIDQQYLAACGLADRVPSWLEACRSAMPTDTVRPASHPARLG